MRRQAGRFQVDAELVRLGQLAAESIELRRVRDRAIIQRRLRRFVQEVLLRESRFAEAVRVMRELQKQDPGNKRIPQFLGYIDQIRKMNELIRTYEGKMRQNKLNVQEALQLANLYRQAGQTARFKLVIDTLLKNTNMPWQVAYQCAILLEQAKDYKTMDRALQCVLRKMPRSRNYAADYLKIAQLYASGHQAAGMVAALEIYLKLRPDDWKGWLDLASLKIGLKDTAAAREAVRRARRLGGLDAEAIIRKDPRFAALLQTSPAASRDTTGSNIDLLKLPGIK